jgi:hypothetical protein
MFESRCLLSALAYSLTTNQSTYQSGQPVQMSFTETNTSATPVKIVIGPANSGFDVAQNGKTVWASNAGIQPQYLRLETLQPGQSVTLTASWNGVSNVGPPTVETGSFTVTNQQAPTAASASFVIQPAAATPPNPVSPPITVSPPAPVSPPPPVIEPHTASTPFQPVVTSGEPIITILPGTQNNSGALPIIVLATGDGLSVLRGPREF